LAYKEICSFVINKDTEKPLQVIVETK